MYVNAPLFLETTERVKHQLHNSLLIQFSFFCSTPDRKSTRLNSSHVRTSYAVFCLKKKNPVSPSLPEQRHRQTAWRAWPRRPRRSPGIRSTTPPARLGTGPSHSPIRSPVSDDMTPR